MKVTRKPKKLRKLTAIMFALAFTIAGVDMASADTTVTPTLDTIKTSETTYLGGTLTPYTLSTTQGTNTHSVIINGTTYWFTPKTGDKDVVTLANTGSGAIKTTTEASKAVFSVGSTYYTYDANKLPISGYTLTEHATKQTGDITIGAKYYSIDLKTPTDKSGTGHVTYSLSSGIKAADVSIPEGKTQTIYYTYNNGGYTSSGRVNNPTSNITNKLFNGVATAANGSAIYNNDNPAGSVNITADFTNNAITNPDRHTSAAITNYSGATSATTSSLGNIIGDFINNSVTATGEYSYDIYAAAIFNRTRYGGTATIGDITGDFINNHTESESGQTNGGAIFNRLYDSDIDIAKIGNIKGNFINNYAKGTVAYGGAIYNVGTIASVTGDFTGNFADAKKSGLGGAIYNISGTIASITGDFIGNYAQGPTYAEGGAINNSGTINSVTGDFINNYAKGSTTIQGGAIYNKGTIASITGDFINNYAKSTTGDGNVSGGAIHNEGTITDISGSFTNNYAESSSLAQGGAIYNKGTNPITIIGDFIGNHATSSTDWAIGGAIANCAGKTINFNGTNTFSNNYAQGTTAQGGAIYNKGIINFNGTNTFSGNYTTTDGTTHVANDIHNEGTINILGGTTTINGGISDAATPTGIINIGGTTDGTLSLGSDATLVAKTLTVNTTGTLIANAAALNVTNTIANAGTLTLTGDNKTNVNAISGAGTTVINGTITQTANKSIAQNIDIKDNKKLTIGATDVGGAVATNTSGEIVLNTGTINKAVSGSGKTTIDGDITVGTDGSLVNNITVNENKKLTANAGKLGTNALANSGTLSLTGGNLAQNVSGDEGTFEVNGTVTNNDGKTIVQKVVNILSGKAFTTDVDKVTATNGIANAGTLTLTGDNKTNANAISGEGTTVINGTITQDSSKNIAQKALSILSGKSLTAGAEQITTTDGISNAGTLTLTGDNKTNTNAIGGEGTTIINGTITQTKDKKITNAIKVNENKSLTANAGDIGGDVTNSGNVNL